MEYAIHPPSHPSREYSSTLPSTRLHTPSRGGRAYRTITICAAQKVSYPNKNSLNQRKTSPGADVVSPVLEEMWAWVSLSPGADVPDAAQFRQSDDPQSIS